MQFATRNTWQILRSYDRTLSCATSFRRFRPTLSQTSALLIGTLRKDKPAPVNLLNDYKLPGACTLEQNSVTRPYLTPPWEYCTNTLNIDKEASDFQTDCPLLRQHQSRSDYRILYQSKEAEPEHHITHMTRFEVVGAVLLSRSYLLGAQLRIEIDHGALQRVFCLF